MRSKQLSADLARIRSVVEGDRRCVSGDVERMLKYDLNCVLGGYFETGGIPDIEIVPTRGGLKVSITMYARSVKSAGVRPADGGALT